MFFKVHNLPYNKLIFICSFISQTLVKHLLSVELWIQKALAIQKQIKYCSCICELWSSDGRANKLDQLANYGRKRNWFSGSSNWHTKKKEEIQTPNYLNIEKHRKGRASKAREKWKFEVVFFSYLYDRFHQIIQSIST